MNVNHHITKKLIGGKTFNRQRYDVYEQKFSSFVGPMILVPVVRFIFITSSAKLLLAGDQLISGDLLPAQLRFLARIPEMVDGPIFPTKSILGRQPRKWSGGAREIWAERLRFEKKRLAFGSHTMHATAHAAYAIQLQCRKDTLRARGPIPALLRRNVGSNKGSSVSLD